MQNQEMSILLSFDISIFAINLIMVNQNDLLVVCHIYINFVQIPIYFYINQRTILKKRQSSIRVYKFFPALIFYANYLKTGLGGLNTQIKQTYFNEKLP